jgi:hypothetical protein
MGASYCSYLVIVLGRMWGAPAKGVEKWTCSHGGHCLPCPLPWEDLVSAAAEGVEKVSEWMTTCSHGGHFIYFVLFLWSVW